MNHETLQKTTTFNHEGNEYKIITTANENGYKVTTTLNGKQVYPSYSIDYGNDLNHQFENIISGEERLVEIAISDIQNNFYKKKTSS